MEIKSKQQAVTAITNVLQLLEEIPVTGKKRIEFMYSINVYLVAIKDWIASQQVSE